MLFGIRTGNIKVLNSGMSFGSLQYLCLLTRIWEMLYILRGRLLSFRILISLSSMKIFFYLSELGNGEDHGTYSRYYTSTRFFKILLNCRHVSIEVFKIDTVYVWQQVIFYLKLYLLITTLWPAVDKHWWKLQAINQCHAYIYKDKKS